MYTEFLEYLASFMNQEDIKLNEPMKKHTSFRVGGPAKVFLTVHSEEILSKILMAVNERNLPYFVLGNGSNLLVSDQGYEGVMIYLGEEFSNIEILTVEEHDDIIGFLSHLTHIIACSLMQAHETDSFIRYTGDSFRDLTRIAKINENLWSELFLANKSVLLKEIKNFKESLSNIETLLENEDLESLKESLRVSTERRKAFDKK